MKDKYIHLKFDKSANPYQGLERDLQESCCQLLTLNRIKWFFHPPNEGKRTQYTGRKMKAQGLKKGVSDLIIFDLNLAVEVKAKRNTPSDSQAEWLEYFRSKKGWHAYWINSLEEFEEMIKWRIRTFEE